MSLEQEQQRISNLSNLLYQASKTPSVAHAYWLGSFD